MVKFIKSLLNSICLKVVDLFIYLSFWQLGKNLSDEQRESICPDLQFIKIKEADKWIPTKSLSCSFDYFCNVSEVIAVYNEFTKEVLELEGVVMREGLIEELDPHKKFRAQMMLALMFCITLIVSMNYWDRGKSKIYDYHSLIKETKLAIALAQSCTLTPNDIPNFDCIGENLGKIDKKVLENDMDPIYKGQFDHLRGVLDRISDYEVPIGKNSASKEFFVEQFGLTKGSQPMLGHVPGIHRINVSTQEELNALVKLYSSYPKHLRTLREINLSGFAINDANALGSFTQLRKLSIGKTLISDLSFLSKLHNLEVLEIHSEIVKADLADLAGMKNLLELNLSNSKVSGDTENIVNLPNLHVLDLSYVETISDFESLCQLNNLKTLKLSSTHINDSDLECFGNLRKLKTLSLSHTNIEDISPLKNLGIETLYLANTDIVDSLNHINFRYLDKLYLGTYDEGQNLENVIHQILPDWQRNNRSLEVYLNGNPIDG